MRKYEQKRIKKNMLIPLYQMNERMFLMTTILAGKRCLLFINIEAWPRRRTGGSKVSWWLVFLGVAQSHRHHWSRETRHEIRSTCKCYVIIKERTTFQIYP